MRSKDAQRQEILDLREQCELDLFTFAKTMFPNRYYGDVHQQFFHYLQHDPSPNKLGLLPRDHQKSHCIAVLAAWRITIRPWVTINYVSASASLAEAQLFVIKNILSSEVHRMLWPEMLNYIQERGEWKHRSVGDNVWQQMKFMVDHPDRIDKGVRDATVAGATINTTSTGLHSEITIFDDLVTDENYESDAAKRDVMKCYKNFAKIATTGSEMFAVGTRYAGDDLYALLKEEVYDDWDEHDDLIQVKAWSVFERVVEDSPKRTGDGVFLWPRMHFEDGESYGFDRKELAKKRGKLLLDGDAVSYFSQYYNDPNHESLNKLSRSSFKYFEKRNLVLEGTTWHYDGKPLKLYAGGDLAFTDMKAKDAKRRDWTALCVIGIDCEGFVYVLALERFKTDKPEEYYNKIMELYNYWGFKEITLESNNAGKVIKNQVEGFIRKNHGTLIVHGKAHTSHDGRKEERIASVLEPRYRTGSILHEKGGYSKMLEDEIVLRRPAHDDLKDALAITLAEAMPPRKRTDPTKLKRPRPRKVSRFGGTRGRR